MKSLARAFQLTGPERRLLARAFGWLLAVRFGLMVLPLQILCRRLQKVRDDDGAEFTLAEAVWAIEAIARRLPGTRCLARSLALQALLRAAGIDSELRIGVAKEASDGLIAHAWVVCEGQPVAFNEDLSRFAALPLPRI